MGEKYVIHTTEKREFHISKTEDGNFLFQIVKGKQLIANPIFSPQETEKMKEALVALLSGK